MTWSVLIVDHNPAFLRTLAHYLAVHGEGAVHVVGTVRDARDVVAQAEALQPDVVLIDLQLPLRSGLVLLPHLRTRLPDARLIALTLLDPYQYEAATLAAGADAFVSKARLEHDLLPTLYRLAARAPCRPGGW